MPESLKIWFIIGAGTKIKANLNFDFIMSSKLSTKVSLNSQCSEKKGSL